MNPKLDISFTQKVLSAFKKINSEITIDTLEHDFSPRLAKYFIEAVLGYEGREYAFERGRTDLTLLDENNNRVIVIETKRPRENLDAEEWREQAGKYADSSTRFVGLTNGYRFLLWEVTDKGRILRVDLNFKTLVDTKRVSEDKLSTNETGQILFLSNIMKEQIQSEAKYSKFDEYYAKIDVSEEIGFDKLIEQLNYLSNDLLRQYTYSAFDEYYAGYAEYKQTRDELEIIKKQNGNNKKQAADIARYELKTEGKYKKYASFSGYYIWKAISNRPDSKEENNKLVFCKESIYVLINRLLFIRICEDKGLLSKKISNGGIEKLREQLYEPVMPDAGVFKQIIFFSYNGANNLYYHFYEKDNPLDWYESGDGDLDRVLNRVLWILNQFNFAKVDRDVLGKLYEKYLPKEERKALGEFYTPDEVIDYILDEVEYVPNKAIESKNIIDPACGSGGFLVRATRRLIARYAVIFGKATPKEALDNKKWQSVYERLTPKECEEIVNSVALHIHGFDINPFAVNISEMNLLFQIIDLYFKAVKGNKTFKVPRFKVYETDSLEMPTAQAGMMQFYGATGKNLAKDKDASDELKKGKYDFVVGNPPYLSSKAISSSEKEMYERTYDTATGQYDLYGLFIELGIKMLKDDGRFGFIVPDAFLGRSNAEPIRKLILSHGLQKALQVYGVFDDPAVANVIITTRRGAIEVSISKTEFANLRTVDNWLNIQYKMIFKLPNSRITPLTKKEFDLIEKMNNIGKPLENLLSDYWRGEELGKDSEIIKKEEKDAFKKIIFGEDIHKYKIDFKGRFINPLDIKKGERYFNKKIMVRQLGEDLNAVMDENGDYVTSQAVYNLVPKINLGYLLGILNSSLIDWYYTKLFKEKELFPRILLENLKILPIIEPESSEQKELANKISATVKKLEQAVEAKKEKDKIEEFKKEIDSLIFKLYGITIEEKRIIEQ